MSETSPPEPNAPEPIHAAANAAGGAPLNPQVTHKIPGTRIWLIVLALTVTSGGAYWFLGKKVSNNINKIQNVECSTRVGLSDGGFDTSGTLK